ncbi:alpha/beta-hydrolase [Tothia fuscella]|uniref:Carboxylic ester hydrolase n=1 Tax=Tothia fuscella TaxID=1048955 RepID=A0A9P4NN24_9PEZI|nr:alpha/beta-hydrolase [Tothia fuscella]
MLSIPKSSCVIISALLSCTAVHAWPVQSNDTRITAANGGLPVVDIGYELHQAASFNESGGYYNFSNIRYAAPPTGENRWRVPQEPTTDRSAVNNGSVGRICPQASPAWTYIAGQFIPQYLQGQPINITAAPTGGGEAPVLDPRTTEDCLFLDIIAPKKVFEQAGGGKGAPVLVWLYGGGFASGDKAGINTGNPAGLIRRSEDGIVFVALNYRLGAFGWLSGPTFQIDGTANLGLHDQRFALNWIQKHIAAFGGDPEQVTVMGESAGGASIMHQITAYGGKPGRDATDGGAPFAQAIIQSPGFLPDVSNTAQEQRFETFLLLANVSSLAEARKLPTEALIAANLRLVAQSPYGSFTFAPSVDGDFIPALAGILLLHGQFDKDVKLMVGHNTNEGLYFASPENANETNFLNNIRLSIPTANAATLEYITTVLYPQVYDGSYGYLDPIQRVAVSAADLGFVCNTRFLDTAFKGQTYSYRFAIPPALHGDDVPYSFYNGDPIGPYPLTQSLNAALTLQDWIVSFTKNGVPTAPDVPSTPAFPQYGAENNVAVIGADGITLGIDDAANPRCTWWQKALYL